MIIYQIGSKIEMKQQIKNKLYIYIYISGVGGVWVQMLGDLGARVRVILVLRECTWIAPAVSLVLPAFDDTGSLGSPPRQVVYPPG